MPLMTYVGGQWVPAATPRATTYGKLTLTVDRTIADATATVVDWSTLESYGTASWNPFTRTYVTPGEDGLYEICASMQMRPPASTGRSRLLVQRTRAGITTDIMAEGLANVALDVVGPGMNVTDVQPLLADDQISMSVFQTSTASASASLVAGFTTYLTITRVGT